MKKLIVLIITVSLMALGACSKNDTSDQTAGIVGTYVGTMVDTSNVAGATYTQTIVVTKVDNNNVKIQPQSGTASATFTATVAQNNGQYILAVEQGGGISGNPYCTSCSSTANGGEQNGTLVYSILITTSTTTGMESFQGTKQ